MEIAELEAFLAVNQHGSFSAAAKVIHLTQPAVSKRVAQLENRLNKSLFDRIGHQIQLTEAGQTLLPHAQHIMHALQEGSNALNRVGQEPTGSLRIATSYHIGLHYLPPILKSYYNDYPGIELDIKFMDSEDALAAVEKGEIEMAIITLPPGLPDHLKTFTLWQDPMQIYCAKNHHLIKKKSLNALQDYPAILPDMGTITRQLVENEITKQNITINVQLSSNHLESIRMMVEIGLGWSVLPETLASKEIVAVKFKSLSFCRELGIISHKQRTLTHASELFMQRISDIAEYQ